MNNRAYIGKSNINTY